MPCGSPTRWSRPGSPMPMSRMLDAGIAVSVHQREDNRAVDFIRLAPVVSCGRIVPRCGEQGDALEQFAAVENSEGGGPDRWRQQGELSVPIGDVLNPLNDPPLPAFPLLDTGDDLGRAVDRCRQNKTGHHRE